MTSRRYRLTVEGELSASAGRAFEGMTVTRREGTTVLVGPVADQAQLQGLLSRVSDLGLTLLGVASVEDDNQKGV